MQQQVKSSPVYSNAFLHPYWKYAEKVNGRLADGFVRDRHHKLWTIGWIYPVYSKMKIKFQFTIQKRNKLMTPEAERFNGWAAMLGFVAAVGAYATTGNIIPGIF